MNELKIFKNENFGEVRVVEADGKPMFCLVDVCKALDLTAKGVAQRLGDEVISNYPIADSLGREQLALFVSEDGLYDVIFDSRKPEAKKFRKWVTSEVLPSIRKTGGYMVAKEEDTPEEIMARALLIAQDALKRKDERIAALQNENTQQAAQIEADAPKIVFANAVMGSKNSCLIGELAKIISQNGYTIGQNRLFEWLRSNGYLGTRGEYYNIPNQQYIEQGLFELKKGTRSGNDGMMYATITTKVTQKGCQYFINKFIGEQKPPANTTETEQHS